jgi:hypothetical protein
MGFGERVYSRPKVIAGDRIRVIYASGGAPAGQSLKPPKGVLGVVGWVDASGSRFQANFGPTWGSYVVVTDLDEWEKVEDGV